ncbi:DUF1178 family protein [Hydrogenophaga pseudoflava]|uniref:Uncharacterized protein n=1 Tax=Hydrogenophaga pseudoflava TaxID=47421 RepID=A0A4P6WVJ4_HYDPS|nr:DUF1178 family protein [Hydrogenophaga pseudoflava]QBM27537.1 hypothetical protein HPF_07575 [Hydrogenophaga pseudoflava]
MKVLNLQCSHQHDFEGWFASEDDFHQQLERGRLSCPLCGDAQVRKMLSAPRLNLGRTSEEPVARAGIDEGLVELGRTAPGSELQGRLLRAVRELMSQTEDVGERFADQARAMHHGELAQRNIRGRTTPEVAMELIEEGIDVMPLPALPALKETLQ